MCVCLFVLYRNPDGWTDWDKIRHRGGSQGVEGSWGVSTWYPPPPGTGHVKGVWGASGGSIMHFGKNFIKQKLPGAPNLVGAVHLFGPQIWTRKDLGPMSFWSHDHSIWRGVHEIKVVLYVPNSYLVGLDTLYPKRGPSGVL